MTLSRCKKTLLSLAGMASLLLLPLQASAGGLPTPEQLQQLAPDISLNVLQLAMGAVKCANATLGDKENFLTVIDFSRPSREKRLWVFDLRAMRLVFDEWVTHGKNSGGDVATDFSNQPNSYQTSLGLYRTGETYYGKHGKSLRLAGLEQGINSNSEARGIVIHSAAYADPSVIPSLGRLGRSEGCPAVRPAVAQPLIDTLQQGSYVFAYYPSQQWINSSRFLNNDYCPAGRGTQRAAL